MCKAPAAARETIFSRCGLAAKRLAQRPWARRAILVATSANSPRQVSAAPPANVAYPATLTSKREAKMSRHLPPSHAYADKRLAHYEPRVGTLQLSATKAVRAETASCVCYKLCRGTMWAAGEVRRARVTSAAGSVHQLLMVAQSSAGAVWSGLRPLFVLSGAALSERQSVCRLRTPREKNVTSAISLHSIVCSTPAPGFATFVPDLINFGSSSSMRSPTRSGSAPPPLPRTSVATALRCSCRCHACAHSLVPGRMRIGIGSRAT